MKNCTKIISLTLLLTFLGLMQGCGTVKGFGQDVSKTGREIQRAAS
ncbi:MAG: entericidin A/B family lipoprotein [Tatlockia sp.]|nr:entericidin A/B family lipoprotein [Tatlockia sp.]